MIILEIIILEIIIPKIIILQIIIIQIIILKKKQTNKKVQIVIIIKTKLEILQ